MTYFLLLEALTEKPSTLEGAVLIFPDADKGVLDDEVIPTLRVLLGVLETNILLDGL